MNEPLIVKKLIINAGFGYDSVADLRKIRMFKNLNELEISECADVTALPSDIIVLERLKKVKFNWNGVSGIDDWDTEFEKLSHLDSLEILVLGPYNNLGHLSPNVGQLSALRVLDLSFTQTMSIPNEISSLESLEYLDISFTKVKSFPIGLEDLPNLKAVFIYDCNLSEDKELLQAIKGRMRSCEFVTIPRIEYGIQW